MRRTVMQQTAKGLPETIQHAEGTYMPRCPIVRSLERLKWSLWHGNLYKAFHKIAALAPRCGGGDHRQWHGLETAGRASGGLTPRFLMLSIRVSHSFRLGVES